MKSSRLMTVLLSMAFFTCQAQSQQSEPESPLPHGTDGRPAEELASQAPQSDDQADESRDENETYCVGAAAQGCLVHGPS